METTCPEDDFRLLKFSKSLLLAWDMSIWKLPQNLVLLPHFFAPFTDNSWKNFQYTNFFSLFSFERPGVLKLCTTKQRAPVLQLSVQVYNRRTTVCVCFVCPTHHRKPLHFHRWLCICPHQVIVSLLQMSLTTSWYENKDDRDVLQHKTKIWLVLRIKIQLIKIIRRCW